MTVLSNFVLLFCRGQPVAGHGHGVQLLERLAWGPGYHYTFTHGSSTIGVAMQTTTRQMMLKPRDRMRAVRALLALLDLLWAASAMVRSAFDAWVLVTASLPRTLRTAIWLARAGISYKISMAKMAGEDPESDAFQEMISTLHTRWARELLAVCRANGGSSIFLGGTCRALHGLHARPSMGAWACESRMACCSHIIWTTRQQLAHCSQGRLHGCQAHHHHASILVPLTPMQTILPMQPPCMQVACTSRPASLHQPLGQCHANTAPCYAS